MLVAPAAMMRLSKVNSEVPSSPSTDNDVDDVSVPQPSTSVILFFFIRKCTPLTIPSET